MTISNDHREHVYRFIWDIVKSQKSTLLRISGIPNHIHMLVDLNPSVALSTLMREVKAKSSGWMQRDARFPSFDGWAHEYYGASISYTHKDAVIEYIKSQQIHHGVEQFDDEIKRLVEEVGLRMYEDDLL